MVTNEYLYGSEVPPNVPKEVCNKRIELLNYHLNELLEIHYTKREHTRVFKVLDAISFWLKLRDRKDI